MICKKCKMEIPDSSTYCPECGELISSSNHELCPNCKNIVFKDDRYCKVCGYKVYKDNTNITLESINKFNFLRLKNYKLSSTIITLVVAIIMFISLFLPLIPIYNKSSSNYEILDVLIRNEKIYQFNIIQSFKLLFSTLSGKASFIDTQLGYSFGIVTYLFLSLYYLIIAIFLIALIVLCIIGFFKKKYYPINKKITGYILVISIIFTFGASCTGIGNLLITLCSFLLLAYNCIIELISKERKFNKRKFLYKLSLLVILSILILFLGFGSFKTNYDPLELKLSNFKMYYSNIFSSSHFHVMFINNSLFTFSDKVSLLTLSSFYMLFGVGSIVFASISFVECIMSFTFPYIKLPTKKTIIGFLLYIISLILGLIFIYYINVRLGVDTIKIKISSYITFIIYLIALIFVLVAKKGYYKDNKNAIN